MPGCYVCICCFSCRRSFGSGPFLVWGPGWGGRVFGGRLPAERAGREKVGRGRNLGVDRANDWRDEERLVHIVHR